MFLPQHQEGVLDTEGSSSPAQVQLPRWAPAHKHEARHGSARRIQLVRIVVFARRKSVPGRLRPPFAVPDACDGARAPRGLAAHRGLCQGMNWANAPGRSRLAAPCPQRELPARQPVVVELGAVACDRHSCRGAQPAPPHLPDVGVAENMQSSSARLPSVPQGGLARRQGAQPRSRPSTRPQVCSEGTHGSLRRPARPVGAIGHS